jgi:coenzyme F420-dependent glucose-6-phosphate dehydrogenase
MVTLGYALSSEEHDPSTLVRNAKLAEQAGFEFALISDHFHPWTHEQGHSPFVWSVLGAISQVTERIRLGTGVTCPTVRLHPAIVAQAAATTALMLPERFMLGVGSGENLNEHIVGSKWPSPKIRLEMLEDAVTVILKLWKGGSQSYEGKHFRLEDACIFSLPKKPPPLMIAASKKHAAHLAGKLGQGLIATTPDSELVGAFVEAGGERKPRYGQVTICWAKTEDAGRSEAKRIWPNALVNGEVSSELALPRHFEQLTEDMPSAMISSSGGITCGPSAKIHIAAIQRFVDAGFDHVYIHQIGRNQEEFIHFAEAEILPEFTN